MKIRKVLTYCLIVGFLSGCAMMEDRPVRSRQQEIGTVIGGVSGAIIGSQMGGTMGAVMSAVGGFVGAKAGSNWGERAKMNQDAGEPIKLKEAEKKRFFADRKEADPSYRYGNSSVVVRDNGDYNNYYYRSDLW